jgi:hypothetical protein
LLWCFLSFIHSPLLGANPAPEWFGIAHAVDWYATMAALAGASIDGTGPLPADGVNIWDAVKANTSNPDRHMLIQYASVDRNGTKLSQPQGVVRKGEWKLITGYPGWGAPGWDGHFPLPGGPDGTEAIEGWDEAHTHVPFGGQKTNCSVAAQPTGGITGRGGESCCTAAPCLFNMATDRFENHDVGEANPQIVKELLAIVAQYAKSEVTVAEAGLCPTEYGTQPDPRCAEAATKITPPFWVPWLN